MPPHLCWPKSNVASTKTQCGKFTDSTPDPATARHHCEPPNALAGISEAHVKEGARATLQPSTEYNSKEQRIRAPGWPSG